MGLLTIGKALDAAATTAISGYIREHGVTQFLNTYNRVKSKLILVCGIFMYITYFFRNNVFSNNIHLLIYHVILLPFLFLLDIAGDELRFGDEIECGVFVVDNIKKTVKLSVRSREVTISSLLTFKFMISNGLFHIQCCFYSY